MQENRKHALVLVIDEGPDVLGNVASALDRVGYTCHCCETAEAAIRFAQTCVPDLILSDINLNGVSGLELCQQIKQDPSLALVPVMFLSGAQTPDIIRRSNGVGGAYYLRKPFDPEVLVQLVGKALRMPGGVKRHLADRQVPAVAP